MIRIVPRALLADIWDKAEPILAAALDYHPFMSTKGLLHRLTHESAELIVVIDEADLAGCIAMEIIAYPEHRIGNVLALGGMNGSMARFDDEVEKFLGQWCRERSLVSLAMLGRPGWSKVLNARGWRIQPMCTAWLPLQD